MNKIARCYNHRHKSEYPDLEALFMAACSTCGRIKIEIEMEIVTRVVDALLAAGYSLNINDDNQYRPEEPTRDREVILAELIETDDDHLEAHRDGHISWIQFVYGNDGHDVINDYTMSLEEILDPINKFADSLS